MGESKERRAKLFGPRGDANERGAASPLLRWVPAALLALVVGALAVVFAQTPVASAETGGFAQKIFYLHLPCAFSAFLGFLICFLASIRYLVDRDLRHDRLGAAAAEVGVVFTTLVLVTGSIWARAAWGTWWVWDVRLTTTAVLWCIYLGYLVLRANVGDRERRARASAVVSVVGFADVPLVYLSIRWWPTMHPGPVLFAGEGSGLPDPRMKLALALSSVAVLAVFSWLLYLRVEVTKLRDQSGAESEPRSPQAHTRVERREGSAR